MGTLNVRTNHVHVVVDTRGEQMPSPEKVLEEFKSWGTRRLRKAGLIRAEGPTWTYHGSTRWINDADDLASAIDYVVNRQ